MKRILLPFLVLIVMFGSQCYSFEINGSPPPDPDPILPNITTTGMGTFGCLINDLVFLPEKRSLFPLRPMVNIFYYRQKGELSIEADRYNKEAKKTAYIYLKADGVLAEQTYTFTRGEYYNEDPLFCNMANLFQLDTKLHNSLTILKIDSTNRIISGLFECSMVNNLCASAEFTSGRFDLTY